MNAHLAKPIQQDLVYSEMVVDVDQGLAAMQPCESRAIATMGRESAAKHAASQHYRDAPSPIRANGPQIAG
jgi:hypothetical protein